jgi:ribosomal protein L35AE/L33A
MGRQSCFSRQPARRLTIDDVTVTEGDGGSVSAVFTVSLDAATGDTVTVDYATSDGTAQAPGDYEPGTGTLTFPPGETSQTVTVQVNGDVLDEADETFSVTLSNPVNATIADGIGVGTIIDDDPAPSLSINDVAMLEGNSGNSQATFTVSLSTASGQAVTVQYATADGTATAGSDYQARTGTLTFAAGQMTRNLNVRISGDTQVEPDETYFVNLSNP